jgi:hypothetical protein
VSNLLRQNHFWKQLIMSGDRVGNQDRAVKASRRALEINPRDDSLLRQLFSLEIHRALMQAV